MKSVQLKGSSAISDVVQTPPVLLVEFPHYCIIALKMALGYVICCVNMHFIILANPLHLLLVPTAPPLTVFQPVSAVWT